MKQPRAWMIAGVAIVLGACAAKPTQPPPPASQATGDLSGTWLLTTESQVGTEEARMTVLQTGTALAGTITSRAGTFDYTGSVDGSAVAFEFTLEVRGNDLELDYNGTVDGNTIKGKAVFGQFGEGTFTARRQ